MNKKQHLDSLYSPVKKDLGLVENLIQKELGSDYKYVNDLVNSLNKLGGKRVRPAILLFCAKMNARITDFHVTSGAIVEILHLATLVHDDVLDESMLRRQVSTINRIYGNEEAIIFGDYLFSIAFKLCARLRNTDATELLANTTQKICVGEMLQLSKKFDAALKMSEYLKIIEYKTAVLFECSARLGCMGGKADRRTTETLAGFARAVGTSFQIIDDVLDIIGQENVMGKSLGTDINKGKVTLPLILLREKLPRKDSDELCRIVSSANGHDSRRAYIKNLVLKNNTHTAAYNHAVRILYKHRRKVKRLDLPELARGLDMLSEFVVSRAF